MPSTVPRTREQLVHFVTSTSAELQAELELELGGPQLADIVCVDDWTVKELLAVRGWWSEAVVSWFRTAREGGKLDLPAPGFKWNETPKLNNGIAKRAQSESYSSVRQRLGNAYEDVLRLIGEMDDHELCDPDAFNWTGKNGACGLINLNTARQYRTAQTYVKHALKAMEVGQQQ
jgi:hypothetical protein